MDCEGQQIWLLEITENRRMNEKILNFVNKELSSMNPKPLVQYVHVITEVPFVNIKQRVSDANPKSVASFEILVKKIMEEKIKKLYADQSNQIIPKLHMEANNLRGKGFCSAILKFRATKLFISFGRNFVGSISSTCEYLIRKRPKYCSLVGIEKLKLVVAFHIPATETHETGSATDSKISNEISRTESYTSSSQATDITYLSSTGFSPESDDAFWMVSPEWKLPGSKSQGVKDDSPVVKFSNDQTMIEPSAHTFSMNFDFNESQPLVEEKQNVSEIELSQCQLNAYSLGSLGHTYPNLKFGESQTQSTETNLNLSDSTDQVVKFSKSIIDEDLEHGIDFLLSENQKSKSELSLIQTKEALLLDQISKLNQTIENIEIQIQLQLQTSISDAKEADLLLKQFREEKKTE